MSSFVGDYVIKRNKGFGNENGFEFRLFDFEICIFISCLRCSYK